MTPNRPIGACSATDLAEATDVCLRSKSYWGYDAAFMDACRDELTITPADIPTTFLVRHNGKITGLVQVSVKGKTANLARLFVCPQHMRKGYGTALFSFAASQAKSQNARSMLIEADPGAVPFYQAMGAIQTGWAASGSIPGRRLPVLMLNL